MVLNISNKSLKKKAIVVGILLFLLIYFLFVWFSQAEHDTFTLLVQCKVIWAMPVFTPKTKNIVKLWFHGLVRSGKFQIFIVFSGFISPCFLVAPTIKPVEFLTIFSLFFLLFLASWVREKVSEQVREQTRPKIFFIILLYFFFYFTLVAFFSGSDGVVFRSFYFLFLFGLWFIASKYDVNYSKLLITYFPTLSKWRRKNLENEQIISLHLRCDLPWVEFFFRYSENSIFFIFMLSMSNSVANFFSVSGVGQTYCYALLALYIGFEVFFDYYILFGCNPVVENSFLSRVGKVLVKHGYKAAIVGGAVCLDHPVEVAKQTGAKPVLGLQNFFGAPPYSTIQEQTAQAKLKAMSHDYIDLDHVEFRRKGFPLQVDTEVINVLEKDLKGGMDPVVAKVKALNNCQTGPAPFSWDTYNTTKRSGVYVDYNPPITYKGGKYIVKK